MVPTPRAHAMARPFIHPFRTISFGLLPTHAPQVEKFGLLLRRMEELAKETLRLAVSYPSVCDKFVQAARDVWRWDVRR